jgi:hypothetical protein
MNGIMIIDLERSPFPWTDCTAKFIRRMTYKQRSPSLSIRFFKLARGYRTRRKVVITLDNNCLVGFREDMSVESDFDRHR